MMFSPKRSIASRFTCLVLFIASCSRPIDYTISYEWSPVEINADIKGSQQIDDLIAPYRVRLDSIMDEVIGYASHDLTSEGRYESTLGTFVTKLLKEQSESSYQVKVDVAIMNHHGGLRAPLNQGPVTLGEVFEVMPFENEMILLEIPGDSLEQVIKFIGKSGRSMIWPVSFHVTADKVTNILIDGKELEPEKNYILTISDYLANGGSGFHMLSSAKRMEVESVKLRDMIEQEIRQISSKGDSIKIEVANFITVSDQ